MKKKVLRKFLRKNLSGGHCELCGKLALMGLKRGKELICFNCLRLIMKYLGKQFDISFLMTGKSKKSRLQRTMISPPEEEAEDEFEREFNRRKVAKNTQFSRAEIEEMRGGSRLAPFTKKKKKKKKQIASGFKWMKTQ